MQIHKNVSYTATHVIRFRQRLTKPQLQTLMQKLDAYIEQQNAKKTDDVITAIHTMYLDDGTSDIEMFVAINKAIPSTKSFTYMPKFELTNCIMFSYKGYSHLVPEAYTKLYHIAKGMGLEINPPFYNVSDGQMIGLWENGEVEMDVYVKANTVNTFEKPQYVTLCTE